MGYSTNRFTRAAAPHLEEGERIVAGTWARTPGGFAAERAFGLAAGIATQIGSAEAGNLRLPKAFEVAVTDRRLLFFDRSAFTGRPHRVVASVTLAQLAVAEHTGRRHGIESAAIRMRNGDTVAFEVAKHGARTLVETFVAALNEQLAGLRIAS